MNRLESGHFNWIWLNPVELDWIWFTKHQHQVKVHHNTTFFKIIPICQVTKDKNSSIVCLCRCSAMRNIIRYIVIMIEKLNLLSCRAWVSISWTCFVSPFCHRWSFRSLPLSPLACSVGDTSFPAQSSTWLHRYYLNWTKLDNATTKFNNEMHSADNWVLNPVILHYWQICLFWYCAVLCYNLYC